MRIKQPKTTGLVFKSGKMIVIGARSIENSKVAAHKLVKIINKNIPEKIEFG